MTIVAVVLAATLLASVATFVGLVRSLLRSHARERDLILNQLLHAAGRTWQPPPREPDREREPRSWTASPEQLPHD